MKQIAPIVIFAVLVGCTAHKEDQHSASHQKKGDDPHAGHGMTNTGAMLMVKTDPAEVKAGQPATLRLMIHDAEGAMIKDFETVHEKIIHLIIVREGLDQFAHIHPEVDAAGNITAAFTFPTGGKYRLYADHKPAGKDQATVSAEVQVSGDSPPAPELTPNAPGKVTGAGLHADVSMGNAKVGGATRITFRLMDSSDKPVADLQPYLGARGHLVILSADGTQYVHAHPAEEKETNGTVAFEAHFSRPGIYKAWGQFQRAGQVHTVPFVMKVN